MKKYPHIQDTKYPDLDTVDVYKYQNDFNYSRWTPDVNIKLCNVKWDNNYTHVVNFENNNKRDDYFKNLTGQKVELVSATNLTPMNTVKLPVPIETAQYYNYLTIELPYSDLDYDNKNKRRTNYFYFINSVESIAPSTTEFTISLDEWTTYINDITISNLTLERGHLPVALSDTDTFLNNPIENNKYLLSDDVNFEFDTTNIKESDQIIFNDNLEEMYACFLLAGDMLGEWGTYQNKDVPDDDINFQIPSGGRYSIDGTVPQFYPICIHANIIDNFLKKIDILCPQFKQCIKACFFASTKMIDVIPLRDDFYGFEIFLMRQKSERTHTLITLTKEKFNFEEEQKKYAKLYTYPYSLIEITNEKGDIIEIHTQDMISNTLTIDAVCDLTMNLNFECFVNGVGGSSTLVSYANASLLWREYGGNWYKQLMQWKIPTYTIVTSSLSDYDVNSHYERIQLKNSAETTYASEIDSIETTKTTTLNGAIASRDNANTTASSSYNGAINSANTTLSNTALQVALNSAITANSNRASQIGTTYANELNQALQAYSAGYTRATVQKENDAEWSTTCTTNTGAAVKGIVGAATNALSGNIGGAIGNVVNGATDIAVSMANLATTIQLAEDKAELSIAQSQNQVNETNQNANDNVKLQTESKTTQVDLNNNCATAQANNSANLQKANALLSYNASTGNATRTYNTETSNATLQADMQTRNAERTKTLSYQAINNTRRQQGFVRPNPEFGVNDPQTGITRPMLIQANVKTQSKNAIKQTCDEFAKYGYMLNQNIQFEKWNYMNNFDYWKASDIWLTSKIGVPASSLNSIRDIILQGTTIWRNPDNMLGVNIYDN